MLEVVWEMVVVWEEMRQDRGRGAGEVEALESAIKLEEKEDSLRN